MKAEEEQSKDGEGSHGTEIASYFSLNHPDEKVLASFTRGNDAVLEATINDFKILANGEPTCASDTATARTLSCEICKPAGPEPSSFRLEKTGSTRTSSNGITYTP